VKFAYWRWGIGLVLVAVLAACSTKRGGQPAPPAAWIERFEVTSRKPAFGGANFRPVGQYELITAVASVRVDPFHPANRDIADLRLAIEDDGFVRYRTDVAILRPLDANKSSKVLLFEPPSRGRKLALALLNDGGGKPELSADAGHGWVMRSGHTMVWIGWQGDVALSTKGEVVGTRLPVLGTERKPVVGKVLEEFVFDNNEKISRAILSYPAATPSQLRASVSVRARPDSEATILPEDAWRYLSEREIEINRSPDFDAGALYQFIYEARDPMVTGLGLAATRDLASFLKSAAVDESGQPHPLGDLKPVASVAVGVSQSARFLREFFWNGFNAGPEGGKVFDAALIMHAGALKTFSNARWALSARYSRQHEGHWVNGDQFPFSYGEQVDPISARKDGIFARCRTTDTCPKTMHVDSSQEFWQARASLVLADGLGRDQPLPEDVRAYLLSSTQQVPPVRPEAGACQHLSNPVPHNSAARALLVRLIEWARDGRVPPASNVPSVAQATLAAPDREAVGFPDLSALNVPVPAGPNELTAVDYGVVPPLPDRFRPYKLLVPRTDRDGNEVAGIREPDIQVPVGTFTGWNLRKEGFALGQLCGLNGAYLPLANDANARTAANDPRPSIAERYPTRLHYVQRMQVAAEALRAEGVMLDEDVGRWVDRARVQGQAMQLPR